MPIARSRSSIVVGFSGVFLLVEGVRRLTEFSHDVVGQVHEAVDGAHADEAKRAWWDRYLKGEARFRGVSTADIRRLAGAWWTSHDGEALGPADQLETCLALLRCPMTEDKLAGILFFQEILAKDLSLLNLIDSEFSMLNRTLQKFYGLPEVEGLRQQRIGKLRVAVVENADLHRPWLTEIHRREAV